MTDLMFYCNSMTFSFHLLFSPARPLTNFSAEFNLLLQALASASTLAFSASASSKFLFKVLTLSVKILTFSFTIARSFFFYSTSSLALATISWRGFTSLKILLYSMILTTQEASLEAAKF